MTISQADTTEPDKGHCPKCGPERFVDVVGEHRVRDGDDDVWLTSEYRILVCRGCANPFFQVRSFFSEDIDYNYLPDGSFEASLVPEIIYYPSPIKRNQPAWLLELEMRDFGIGGLFKDIYRCLDADLPIPAAIATRTTFDRATELLGINSALTFDQKLNALVDQGKISLDERDTLEVLVDAGGAAAHRGWRPSAEQLETLVSLIEAFLHRTFVLGEAARQLKAAVPPKPSRPPKAKA